MPPKAVRTVKDLIFWQYLKIISDSPGFGKKNSGFIMTKFKQLSNGQISWNEIREYIKEKENNNVCILCGDQCELTIDHFFPRYYNGPDNEKNVIWVCKKRNSSKSKKRLYEYFTSKNGLDAAKYNVPKIAEGKYLKFIYKTLKNNKWLDFTIDDIKQMVCPQCDLKKICIKENSTNKLSPLCLDELLTYYPNS